MVSANSIKWVWFNILHINIKNRSKPLTIDIVDIKEFGEVVDAKVWK